MKIVKGILYAILTLLYAWISSIILVFHGPFPYLKSYAIGMISTSMHAKYLEPLTLWTVSLDKNKPSMTTAIANFFHRDSQMVENIKNADSTIKVETYKDDTFSAKIMLVSNPTRLKVAVTKYKGDVGETVSEMVADAGAVAGFNGGAFQDVAYRGTGGIPLGTTIHNGQIITKGDGKQPIIGFTKEGQLVVGTYSDDQLMEFGVTEALTFGPVLVKDGEGVVKGDGGWGAAPRTAIGQREDGTVIVIVTDGRGVHGVNNLGATMRDLESLMLKYGAINAANLDGGSSSTMVKDGKLVNDPTDVLGERKIATSFIVMPD